MSNMISRDTSGSCSGFPRSSSANTERETKNGHEETDSSRVGPDRQSLGDGGRRKRDSSIVGGDVLSQRFWLGDLHKLVGMDELSRHGYNRWKLFDEYDLPE